MSRCCGFVVQLSICCRHFDLLWVCCGFIVQQDAQQALQQIHNKSNKWSSSINHQHNLSAVSPVVIIRFSICIIFDIMFVHCSCITSNIFPEMHFLFCVKTHQVLRDRGIFLNIYYNLQPVSPPATVLVVGQLL